MDEKTVIGDSIGRSASALAADQLLSLPSGHMVDNTYRIFNKIGIGAMGVVYRAEDIRLRRQVAIKFLNPIIADSQEIVELFRDEARALARLNHPNIVQIYAFGEEKGCLFFSMEFVNGQTLSALIHLEQRFRADQAAPLLRQIAEALDAAHVAGMIHRDLKPANVMILPPGRVKVMDFGLAGVAASATGRAMGTPRYMAPEQALGLKIDARADLYALGIIAYELFVGDVPFSGENYRKTLDLHVNAPVPSARRRRSDVPREWDELIRALLAKRPEERPSSASEVIERIDQLLGARTGGLSGTRPEPVVHDPRAELEKMYQKARAHFDIGETRTARELVQEVLFRDDKHAKAWNLLGAIELKTGRSEIASTHFTKALVIDPAFYEAALNTGMALLRQQRYAEAIWAFERAAGLMPGLAAPWINLGEARLALRDLPGAKKAWEKALELDSANQALRKRYEELKRAMAL